MLGKWAKLNKEQVCFGSKQDTPGNFTYHPTCLGKEIMIGCIKLVHRSGQFACRQKTLYNSNWGCGQLVAGWVNVVVTDYKKRLLWPKPRLTILHPKYGKGLWHYVPGFHEDSPVLPMCDLAAPVCLSHGQTIHFWYGEDLTNVYEMDNIGTICIDVYGFLVY